MTSDLKKKDWSTLTRKALTATEIVAKLAQLEGWSLHGDGANVAIEKTYRFANFHETMAFMNALAWICHTQDHHPEVTLGYEEALLGHARTLIELERAVGAWDVDF